MYKRLPFNQYFIDISDDYKKMGKARFKINYYSITYIQKLLWLIPLKCSSDYYFRYEEDRNVIQLYFQDTDGWKDWIVNLLYPAKMYDQFKVGDKQIQLKACMGWMKIWFMMKHQIRDIIKKQKKFHPDAEVEIIGWSLGSAMAQFCAQDLNFNFGIKSYLYTYGSVNPWRGKKSNREYLRSCCKESYNFMHKNDVVCYCPPVPFKFATNPVKLGKFNLFKLFNPLKWYAIYDEASIYKFKST